MVQEDDENLRNSMSLRPTSLSTRPTSLSVNGNEKTLPEESVLRSLSTGTLKYPDDEHLYTFSSANLQDLGAIGNGNFGTVYKMRHKETGKLIAVKRIRCNNIGHREQIRLLREHDTIVKSEKGPNIVKFYGAIFSEGDCWICMELMDISMDLLYKRVYMVKNSRLNENVVGHITVCTVDALDYLKKELKIIHRDVKPSNILVDGTGAVKLCDFGICGQLEESFAKTHDAGCQPYLAPERITSSDKYDVRSDVWSLGITLYEIATGKFPYQEWNSLFDQIATVVSGDPPILHPDSDDFHYSLPLVKFINTCLTKDRRHRPKYDTLKSFDFYRIYAVAGPEIEEAKRILGVEAIDTRNHPVDHRG
ncbi:MAP kinase kinase mkk-4 [Caenorhabditis elegans]|uniref:MAP kinase kinase mkk-4 n=1 Tax=Caenorhabditis elegans TaxID=6239 RepID=MKK4_CAEEL|nr:MAP kinase kinase mkk-4 [Caenorhabditis elegans]Q20347.3 RecName: Full=MAP kinase kinase mkk-4 [Caenorhabditis elegans]CAA88264.1 MAP kinase kinase mkk-4 [Caenorhabditis elegans]|eukprot:NP_509682.1 MAP kinase kinase mkk-4 [Caenorhabditis elegans]